MPVRMQHCGLLIKPELILGSWLTSHKTWKHLFSICYNALILILTLYVKIITSVLTKKLCIDLSFWFRTLSKDGVGVCSALFLSTHDDGEELAKLLGIASGRWLYFVRLSSLRVCCIVHFDECATQQQSQRTVLSLCIPCCPACLASLPPSPPCCLSRKTRQTPCSLRYANATRVAIMLDVNRLSRRETRLNLKSMSYTLRKTPLLYVRFTALLSRG